MSTSEYHVFLCYLTWSTIISAFSFFPQHIGGEPIKIKHHILNASLSHVHTEHIWCISRMRTRSDSSQRMHVLNHLSGIKHISYGGWWRYQALEMVWIYATWVCTDAPRPFPCRGTRHAASCTSRKRCKCRYGLERGSTIYALIIPLVNRLTVWRNSLK